jgi:acyl-CoA dehydrogenase
LEKLVHMSAPGGVVVPALRRSEARLLSEVAREVLASAGDAEDPWAPLTDGGWIGVGVEEADGGQGGSVVEAAALAEALGRTAANVPLLEAVLAAQLAAGAAAADDSVERVARGDIRATVVPRIVLARRDRGGYVVSGGGWITPWASQADLILMLAKTDEGVRLFRLPRDRVRLEHGSNLAGEPRDRLTLIDPHVASEATSPFMAELEDVLSTTAVLCAGRLVGALSSSHELSLEYARERRQFGKPIGNFQAVAHALARQAGSVELAAAALQAALEKTGGPSGHSAAVIARVAAGTVAPDVAAVAHQVHGAIGVTREYELHRFTLRLQAWPHEFGATGWWQRRLGREAIAAGSAWWDRTAPES